MACFPRDITKHVDGKTRASRDLLMVQRRGSVVYHLLVEKSNETVTEAIAELLEVSQERVKTLIHMGCVRISPFPPEPRTEDLAFDGLCPKQATLFSNMRRIAESLPVGKGVELLEKPKLLSDDKLIVKEGNYLRVTVNPRTFPLAETTDWSARVVESTDHYVVVDKPAGVPSVPSADNLHQNTAVCVGKLLGYKHQTYDMYHHTQFEMKKSTVWFKTVKKHLPESIKPQIGYTRIHEKRPLQLLYAQQRLDLGTSGLMVMGRSANFARWFQHRLSQRDGVRKRYKALCYRLPEDLKRSTRRGGRPVKPGQMLTHYLEVGVADGDQGLARRTVAHRKIPLRPDGLKRTDLKESKLVVDKVHEFKEHQKFKEGLPELAEFEITLLTGRTHQIRAQLESEGWYIVGDPLYPINVEDENISPGFALQACELQVKKFFDPANAVEDPAHTKETRKARKRKLYMMHHKPSTVGDKTFRAPDPWWRSQPEEVAKLIEVQIEAITKHKDRL